MRSSLLVLKLADPAEGPCPCLLVDSVVGECAIIDPPQLADRATTQALKATIRSNRWRVNWVLHTLADPLSYAGGAALRQQYVAAQSATGRLTARSAHNQSASVGTCAVAADCVPQRLLEEGERLQVGGCFGRVRHLTDDERIVTGYLFEHLAVLGPNPERVRPLLDDCLLPWPASVVGLC